MVCAVDHLAADAGVAMLRIGGSAADAAIAANAVLAVTCQHMCGLGGDLFALIHDGRGAPTALNASGRAGSGADPDRMRAQGHTVMPAKGDIRSVPIPGCVDGWLALHRRYGRLPLVEVLGPARQLAISGFPVSPLLAATIPLIADIPGAEDFTTGGPPRPGDVIRRPGIGRCLTAIGANGRDGFYGGEFGEGLVALGCGEYQPDDLARPQADWVDPLGVGAWGDELWTVPPNSQGYLTLAGAWIADGLDVPEDPEDARAAHLLIEAARQAAYDRPAVLSETADGAALLAPGRLRPRRDAIDAHRAGTVQTPIAPGGTMHLTAIDRSGMGVSLTQSNAGGFGAHLVVQRTGVFLQNRGIGFSLERGHAAEYRPGRRPPHTLSPALVTGPEGDLRILLGTMGGDHQPQVLLQLLHRLLVAGERPGRAVAAGRWVLASRSPRSSFGVWDSGGNVRVQVEGHAPAAWAGGLAERGHEVDQLEAYSSEAGHAQVITVGPASFAGAADPRSLAGAAVGW
jgi:gamma-glutamyltranspeptidase/glutathione hydrolase